MYRVGIIGTGIVGSAMALILRERGYLISGVSSRTGVSARIIADRIGCRCFAEPEEILPEAETVFLTLPDRELGSAALRLAQSGRVRDDHVFLHMSGALPAEILHPLQQNGAAAASVHPLQSFAHIEKALDILPGSFFAVQGDEKAVQIAISIVKNLGGKPFMIGCEDKALYHLGACAASNYLVSLMHFAVTMYTKIGMSPEQAVEALLPLVKGTLTNVETTGPAKALTGPVARGDIETVEKHLQALSRVDAGLKEFYKTLGRYTTGVAVEKGTINKDTARKLLSILREEEPAIGQQ